MKLFPSLRGLAATAIGCLLALSQAQAQGVDLLPSWNDGAALASRPW